MVVQTWGFVKTKPNYPWTKVELRAEVGAVFRVSGATYSDALACLARVRSTLQGMGVEIEWGQDLDYSKEKVLTQDFDVPHFLTHYPRVAKPFYHRPDPEDPKYVLCHDLLAPEGYGEIIGGGERTWSEQEILERIDEEGTPRDPYEFYIDVRRYGGVPHGGFGLGVDRVCSWLSGAEHIREVIPFPRDSRRVTP